MLTLPVSTQSMKKQCYCLCCRQQQSQPPPCLIKQWPSTSTLAGVGLFALPSLLSECGLFAVASVTSSSSRGDHGNSSGRVAAICSGDLGPRPSALSMTVPSSPGLSSENPQQPLSGLAGRRHTGCEYQRRLWQWHGPRPLRPLHPGHAKAQLRL